jgi:hypothetical protein
MFWKEVMMFAFVKAGAMLAFVKAGALKRLSVTVRYQTPSGDGSSVRPCTKYY